MEVAMKCLYFPQKLGPNLSEMEVRAFGSITKSNLEPATRLGF